MINHILSILFFFLSHAEKADQLESKVIAVQPKVVNAWENAFYASLHSRDHIPAELLLSIAFFESRYNPGAVSLVRDGKRSGMVTFAKRPPANTRGPFFCGVTQVAAGKSWKRCKTFRDISAAYKKSSEELHSWYLACAKLRRKSSKCVLLGYGGGYPAIYSSMTYYRRVLALTYKLANTRNIHVLYSSPKTGNHNIRYGARSYRGS